MFEPATLLSFITVVLGLFLIPGPAVLLVSMRTAQGGRAVGVMTGLGIACGDFLHAMTAAVGLSAVLMTSALAFNVVKLLGAAYLLWLGIQAFIARTGDSASAVAPPNVTAMRAFFLAVPAEVLNPKTAIFFLAFLPQFVHPERGSTPLQFMTLGLIFVGLSAFCSCLLVLAMRPLGRLFDRLTWLNRWKEKIMGAIFIGLAVKVSLQQH